VDALDTAVNLKEEQGQISEASIKLLLARTLISTTIHIDHHSQHNLSFIHLVDFC
jgi:hypothetical protein